MKAKAAGKREAKRPKTEGPAAAKKAAAVIHVRALEKIGDEMSREILKTPFDLDILESLAEEWKNARVVRRDL